MIVDFGNGFTNPEGVTQNLGGDIMSSLRDFS